MKHIEIVGLGAGDFEQLPLGVYKTITNAEHLFLRTSEHPVVKHLLEEGIYFTSFDEIYEKHEEFSAVYDEITERLFFEAEDKDVVYAVPGHPLVAEKVVQLLLEGSREKGIEVSVTGGQSFIDPLFTALKIDPIEGFQLLDATALRSDQLQLKQHMIICQVYDAYIASEVKLTLMEQLPDEYEVTIITAAGTSEELIKTIKLYELDRKTVLNNLTSVYVPPVTQENQLYHQFATLRGVIATLRGSNGCPWDKKQTHESLKKYLLEETYELFEAINRSDDDNMVEELGDILLQVMLHAQIGADEGLFTIDEVILGLTEKMIRRHPHVFGNVEANTADEVIQNWEEIKKQEKAEAEDTYLLDQVPNSFPSLLTALKYQKVAASVGFDWPNVDQMWEKVYEEIEEFKHELINQNIDQDAATAEFGDVLFALVNVARFYKLDTEEALVSTNQKFKRRFNYIENQVKNLGKTMDMLTLEELDEIWNQAKKAGL